MIISTQVNMPIDETSIKYFVLFSE